MSAFAHYSLSDRDVEFFVSVVVGVTMLSSAAWLVVQRQRTTAPVRHLVLLCALFTLLLLPAAIWIGRTLDIRLISLPVLGEREGVASAEQVQPAVRSQAAVPLEKASSNASNVIEQAACVTALPPPPSLVATRSRASNATKNQAAASEGASEATLARLPIFTCPASIKVAAAPAEAGAIVEPIAEATSAAVFSWRSGLLAVIALWFVGTFLLLWRIVRSCICVLLMRRTARSTDDVHLQALLREVTTRMSLRRVPLLLLSQRTPAPLAVGLGRPAIILPTALVNDLSPEELRDIFTHEAAHLARGDQWAVLLAELTSALYWPILTVHAVKREMQRAREEICDNAVLAYRDPLKYGETLLRVAQWVVSGRTVPLALGILGRRGELERRVAGLVDPRRAIATAAGRSAVVVVMLAFITACALAATTRLMAAPAINDEAIEIALAPARSERSAAGDANNSKKVDADDADVPRDADNPEYAGQFSGRIFGPDDEPIAGARVYVTEDSDSSPGVGPVRTRTDARGAFAFDAPDMTFKDLDGLPARKSCVLSAVADGYQPDWVEIDAPQRGAGRRSKSTALRLELSKEDVPIQGRFLDPTGQPLVGARVRLAALSIPKQRDLDAHLDHEIKASIFGCYQSTERSTGRTRLVAGLRTEAQTGADGRFKLAGLGRDRLAYIEVTAPGVVDASFSVMTRDVPDLPIRRAGLVGPNIDEVSHTIFGAGFTMQLNPERTVTGVVRDRQTHEPIAGMLVGSYFAPNRAFLHHPVVSDAEGKFTLHGLSPAAFHADGPNRMCVAAQSPPGGNYLLESVEVVDDALLVIESSRGIPFRLKVVDEVGQPIEAEVSFHSYSLAWQAESARRGQTGRQYVQNDAARAEDGTYRGHVIPGLGIVTVKMPRDGGFRPARADLRSFVIARATARGEDVDTFDAKTIEQLNLWSENIDREGNAAIVLVDPEDASPPLELTATLVRDKPRIVHLVDPAGEPIVGVQTQGATIHAHGGEPVLRGATLPLVGLSPDHVRRITFTHEERKLIALLEAKADGDEPYTVQLQPWANAHGIIADRHGYLRPAGQIVDESGKPLHAWSLDGRWREPPHLVMFPGADRNWSEARDAKLDNDGRFAVDRLIPGQHYRASIHKHMTPQHDQVIDDVVFAPGEDRDLGAVRAPLSFAAEYTRPTADDQQATANTPSEAWGPAVDGLRVALVPQAPAIDDKLVLRYKLVAENVTDHEVRFSASLHDEDGLFKLAVTDQAMTEFERHASNITRFVQAPQLIHVALPPGERVVLTTGHTQLVPLDEMGEVIKLPTRNFFSHSFHLRPGKYKVAAAVELGPRFETRDAKTGAHTTLSPLPGEWVGKLVTGTAVIDFASQSPE